MHLIEEGCLHLFLWSQAKRKAREALAAKRRSKKRQDIRNRRKKKGLPRWFIYITYVMAFAFCCVSSIMIMLYGITFEPAVARAWLLSSLFAAFMEIFVQQPIKIAGLTVLKERVKAEIAAFKRRQKKKKEGLEEIGSTDKKDVFRDAIKTTFDAKPGSRARTPKK